MVLLVGDQVFQGGGESVVGLGAGLVARGALVDHLGGRLNGSRVVRLMRGCRIVLWLVLVLI